MSRVNSGLIFFFWLTKVRNHPKKKHPIRLMNKVPKGNPLLVWIHSPKTNLDIAPKKPPIITNNKFIFSPFLSLIKINHPMRVIGQLLKHSNSSLCLKFPLHHFQHKIPTQFSFVYLHNKHMFLDHL